MTEKNERLLIYIVFGVICVALIGALMIIWNPTRNRVIPNNINNIDVTEKYENVQKESYIDLLNRILQTQFYDDLFSYVGEEWLGQVDMDKDSLKEWLINEGIISRNQPNITDSTVVTSDIYMYRYEILTAENQKKYVIINETKPGEFYITFEQEIISSLVDKKYENVSYDINFTANTKAVLSNVIQYEVSISNTSNREIHFALIHNKTIALRLSDGRYIYASDISSPAGDEFSIWHNGYTTVTATFFVSLENQNKIEAMEFLNASNSYGERVIYTIDLKEGE